MITSFIIHHRDKSVETDQSFLVVQSQSRAHRSYLSLKADNNLTTGQEM